MQDEIVGDVSNHGTMFVPIVAGSDKTTVLVAIGHQEYHPVYMSPGNLTNIAWHSHRNTLLPVAFLPIPKSTNYFHFIFNLAYVSLTASKKH
jgi:Plavaka transposase